MPLRSKPASDAGLSRLNLWEREWRRKATGGEHNVNEAEHGHGHEEHSHGQWEQGQVAHRKRLTAHGELIKYREG